MKTWTPQAVSDVEAAFGGNAMKLMPPYSEIPDEFKRGRTEWNRLVSDWFFCGVESLSLKPKDGIEQSVALKHVGTIMRSFEPKHEHKEAGAAYLLSLWFTEPKWTRKERKSPATR